MVNKQASWLLFWIFTSLLTARSASAEGTVPAAGDKHFYAEDAVEHYNRGLELQLKGFLNKATVEYKAAIAADSHLEQAYCNLGLIHLAQKQYRAALDVFEKAMRIRPDRSTTLNGYASSLCGLGRREEALEYWRKVIKLDPSFKPAYQNLALELARLGRFQEAKEVLKEGGVEESSPTERPHPKIFDDCKPLPGLS